jgi:hypothetical protein
MRTPLALVLLTLSCASQQTGSGGEASIDPVRTVVTPGEAIDITRHTTIHAQEFAVARERVWDALMGAEADFGMPLQSADPVAGVAIYYFQTATPRIAGRHASSWLDCGRAPGGAPRVNTYHLTLRLRATVEQITADATRVRMSLLGYARDRGIVGDPLPCTSSGQLEKRALAVLVARLGS